MITEHLLFNHAVRNYLHHYLYFATYVVDILIFFPKKVGIEQRTKENELVGMDLETELSLYANKKELNLFR